MPSEAAPGRLPHRPVPLSRRPDDPRLGSLSVRRAAGLFDLTDRVAVVTGATKGIGRAIVEGLAQAGASVVVSSRKQDLCDAVAADVTNATGREALGLACHVGAWDAIPSFVDRVYQRFGHVDVLVNNAGINPAPTPIVDVTLDYWRKLQSVNLEGPLRLSALVAPRMRDDGGGSVINVASVGAYIGGAGNAAYAASKAGLVVLTKVMAKEWAPWKVRVNVISPGPFVSEMMLGAERVSPGLLERSAAGTMLGRVADPAEIIGAAVYLASDASSFVTGEDHVVSGGMLRS
jgi:NAD(P)-dependent dehydrogenase (short-subunit alcohol dehydrogenase family)